MKKFLSLILAALLILSIMTPITVFAENGPYPNDFEKLENMDLENLDITELMNLKLSAIMFLDFGAIEDAPENAIGLVYPEFEELALPQVYSGAIYDMESNTLTLKNVVSKTAILEVLGMGDDFKIKLEGYNELAAIVSSGMEWGGSVTLTGDGELVLGRSKDSLLSGLSITADETASFFRVEDTVKLKFYSNPDFFSDAVSIIGSTITDPAELIQLGGNVVCDEPAFEKYTVEFFEQAEAYDIEWNSLWYYDAAFQKDGAYYVGYEDYNLETYEITGKYELYSVSYDELLDCYVATLYSEEPIKPTGFKKVAEYEPLFDAERNCYIGYTDEAEDDPENTYKYLFYPDYTEFFDLCVDENGNKYGFAQYSYEDIDDATSGVDTYVYNLIDHPTYGLIAVEDTTKTTLDGLTPLKIGEKDYADCYISSNLVINNGGSIIEPAKIKNIKATSTNQGVKITWSADPAAEKYRVYRKVSGAKKWTRLDTIDADETSFIDKTTTSGKKYIYTVRGVNFVGDGTFNSTGVTHTYYEAPDVTIKTTTKGVYLKWAKIAGATKYRIYRQTSGSSKWSLIDTVTGTSFTDKTAKSGKKYYYRVRATNGDVMSGYNEVSKYFLSSPKLSSAKNSASGVKVSWAKVTGAEGYYVYRKSGSGSYKKIGATSKTTYTDKTAKSGTTYTYTVKAYKSKTESSYTTGLSCKYLAAPKVEAKAYTGSIKLSWDKVNNAKEYAVYRKANGESKWTKVATTTKLSYKDTNIKSNKTYSYCVKAINGKTVSGYTTVKCNFLKTPSIKSITNTGHGQKITWDKVSGADGYRIYVKMEDESSWTLLKTVKGASKTSYKNDRLKYGFIYQYTVRAYNDSTTSALDKKGDELRYIAPVPFYLESNKKGVEIGWGNMARIDQFKVYRKATGESKWTVISTITVEDEYAPHFEYIDANVKKGKEYSYRVVAIDSDETNISGYETQTIKYKYK